MYQSTQPYASPPTDPYRSSPIPVNTRQPYSGNFSPPPMPPNANGFSPMPSGQSRYNQNASSPQQQYSRFPPNRYAAPSPYAQRPQELPPARHKGTLAPGKIVQVGDHSVRIERYLSEGGYAHVYLTSSDKPIYPSIKGEKKGRWGERGYTEHCLKRIAFEDEAVWADVKKEIEVMKALPPSPHLTQYLGSAHSRLSNGGYEVFILMEFCAGGGIIDLLNKRLRDRLREIEILNIFTDVCEAVAAMHALTKPLLHRDLKIENVLSQPTSSPPTQERPTPLLFKLCDFGSTTYPASRPPSTKLEVDSLSLDLNKHTTLQYRSPEMVEPMLGWPVGLPSDVWALGVLLYKLCYYITPFEEHGTLAIVNAKYTFPQYPKYSPRLQHLIAAMLVEQPVRRPTVFEVLRLAHDMSGTRPEVDYPSPSRSIPAYSQAPSAQPPKQSTSSSNLLDFTSPPSDPQIPPSALVPTVQPGRRGRPSREVTQAQVPNNQIRRMPLSSTIPPSPQQPLPRPADSLASVAPRVQVTGEKEAQKPAPIQSSQGIDAFGMSSMLTTSTKSTDGFGDSFGMRASKFGSKIQRPSSGFGDSFHSAGSPSSTATQQKHASSPSSLTQFPTSFSAPKTTSPASTIRKTPETSSSIPDGEVSFETRFPSIESLSSVDASSVPLASNALTSRQPSTQHLISPVVSPPASRPAPGPRQQSIMGSLTGYEALSAHQSSSAKADGAPQPHSTNVTGTAFQSSPGGMLNPSSVQSKSGYFDVLDSEPGRTSPKLMTTASETSTPQDLMTGEDSSELSMPSMRPAIPKAPSSSGLLSLRVSPEQPKPLSLSSAPSPLPTGHSRPLLPQINLAEPTSNIYSAKWSPLEQMRGNVTVSSSEKGKKEESSDEESGPEDASASYHRPASPARRGSATRTAAMPEITRRMSAFESGLANGRERSKSPVKAPTKSATMSLPPDESAPRPQSRRLLSSERNRPQSMYAAPPRLSSQSLLSPSAADPSIPTSATAERPSHARQGSTTDMVTRFESMNTPVKPGPSEVNSSNGLPKKPSVAVKPMALRKVTADDSKGPASSPSPMKLINPVKVSKPVRYSETPMPHGISGSSSGRTFPVSKPTPAVKPIVSPSDGRARSDRVSENAKSPAASEAPSSPEKQQPVNLLIQRWNQNGVGKLPPQTKRETYT